MTGPAKQIPALSPVKRALAEIRRLKAELAAARGDRVEPIAIVGVGLRFPGDPEGVDDFWQQLIGGVNAVAAVPADRWDHDALFHPDPGTAGRYYIAHGGFVDGACDFDPEFFGIAPREALSMDPQQRIFMETAWRAFEDAAISPVMLRGSRTGVFLGIANGDYGRLVLRQPDQIDEYASVGTAYSVAAGRLSYFLGLQGPAISVDTACSSSLVAVHLAVQSLHSGESNLAVVAGVNLMLSPEVTINFCRAGMLAADGRCKTFDTAADGYVRSEGCGVVLLKRLSDAVRDGDRILAAISGTAVNQDGRSSGLTAPNGIAQEAVIRSALQNAGVSPHEIGYLEAHGTGTSLGDPIEVRALGAVFGGERREHPLLLGSVKTNLGHLEAAAGMAGLIKAALCVSRGDVPPHLHLREPNRHIDWAKLPFQIPTIRTPLRSGSGVRRAGVSSFGFSGTNAHVVVEEAPDVMPVRVGGSESDGFEPAERPLHVLALSATHDAALRAVVGRYIAHLEESHDAFADICFSANAGRAHFSDRIAVVSRDSRSAAAALRQWLASGAAPGVEAGRARRSDGSSVAFLFPAEADLGWLAYPASSVMRRALLECDAAVRRQGGGPLMSSLPEPALGTSPTANEPLRFAVQYALAAMWRSWGIEPDIVVGEGLGVLAAAATAGIFDLPDALDIVVAAHSAARAQSGRSAVSAAVETSVRERSVHAPMVQFASAASPGDAQQQDFANPTFWAQAVAHPATLVDASSALETEGARRLVAMGSVTDSRAHARWGSADSDVVLVAPQGADHAWHGLLGGLARLYTDGANPDWRAVDRGHVRRKVSLPAYPFQRRRFWLADGWHDPDGVREAGASTTEGSAPSPWQAATAAALDRAGLVPMDVDISSYEAKWAALEVLTHALVRNSLVTMGAFRDPEAVVDIDDVMCITGANPMYRHLVARCVGALERAGELSVASHGWRAREPLELVESKPLWDRVNVVMSSDQPLLRYIRHAGGLLDDVLAGRTSPLETLFPGGAFDMAADLYESAAQLRYVNGIAATALRAWSDARPTAAKVRVLEIGAGTGGTTSSLISVLPDHRSNYDYSDVSDIFLDWGRTKFSGVPFLRTKRFDLEADPADQGMTPGSYDVVVGSNVLHAVRDLRTSLARVRSLLAPGGLLLLVESTGHHAWHDITTGLIEGWQHFEDDVRTDTPLLSVETWHRLLNEAGFNGVAAYPRPDSPAGVFKQHLIMAAAPVGDSPATTTGSVSTQMAADVTPADTGGADALADRFAGAVGRERDDLVMDTVRSCVMEVLHSDPERPPSRDARLMELGVDSLMAVRLRNLLQKRLGLDSGLPSTLVFDYPTIRQISTLVASKLGPTSGNGEASSSPAAANELNDRLERERRLASLSDDEVEAMLLDRLDGGDLE